MRLDGRRLKQDRFLTAYLQNPTISDAARSAGVNRDTVYEWRKDPEFEERFHRLKEQASTQAEAQLEEAKTIIHQAAPKAARRLGELVDASRQDVGLKASESILNRTEKLSGPTESVSFAALLQLAGTEQGD